MEYRVFLKRMSEANRYTGSIFFSSQKLRDHSTEGQDSISGDSRRLLVGKQNERI